MCSVRFVKKTKEAEVVGKEELAYITGMSRK
jgi:hypothetical protein